jgi:hypothetical protein
LDALAVILLVGFITAHCNWPVVVGLAALFGAGGIVLVRPRWFLAILWCAASLVILAPATNFAIMQVFGWNGLMEQSCAQAPL